MLAVALPAVSGFFLALNFGAFEPFVRRLVAFGEKHDWAAFNHVADLGGRLQQIWRNHRGLSASFLVHLAAVFFGASEVWIALSFMGHPVSVAEAVAIESLGQGSRAAAFVLPGGLGVQDGALDRRIRDIRHSGRRRARHGADQAGSRPDPRHPGLGRMAGAGRASACCPTANSDGRRSNPLMQPRPGFCRWLSVHGPRLGHIVPAIDKQAGRGQRVRVFCQFRRLGVGRLLCGGRARLRLCAFCRMGRARLCPNARPRRPRIVLPSPFSSRCTALEPDLYANLAGFCAQDYPSPVQIVFGVDDPADPADRRRPQACRRFSRSRSDIGDQCAAAWREPQSFEFDQYGAARRAMRCWSSPTATSSSRPIICKHIAAALAQPGVGPRDLPLPRRCRRRHLVAARRRGDRLSFPAQRAGRAQARPCRALLRLDDRAAQQDARRDRRLRSGGRPIGRRLCARRAGAAHRTDRRDPQLHRRPCLRGTIRARSHPS